MSSIAGETRNRWKSDWFPFRGGQCLAWWQCCSCGMGPGLIFPVALQGVVVSVVVGSWGSTKMVLLGQFSKSHDPSWGQECHGHSQLSRFLAFSWRVLCGLLNERDWWKFSYILQCQVCLFAVTDANNKRMSKSSIDSRIFHFQRAERKPFWKLPILWFSES